MPVTKLKADRISRKTNILSRKFLPAFSDILSVLTGIYITFANKNITYYEIL